jgi:hypothetical protein
MSFQLLLVERPLRIRHLIPTKLGGAGTQASRRVLYVLWTISAAVDLQSGARAREQGNRRKDGEPLCPIHIDIIFEIFQANSQVCNKLL